MVDIFLRGAALCLLTAFLLLCLARASATCRHLVCALALLGLPILPLAPALVPPLPLLPPENAQRVGPEPEMTAVPAPLPEPLPMPTQIAAAPSSPASRPLPDLRLTIWALGAVLLLARLAVSLGRLRTLERTSRPETIDGVTVRWSDRVTTPLTWGIVRPTILLPEALRERDGVILISAVRHERAHVQRRDWLWHLLAEIVCALCWFQPGAWWLRRRLRAESERACDDRVLLAGVAGTDYAAHLIEIVRAGRESSPAPGMGNSQALETRVRCILDPKAPRRTSALRLALTALLTLALLPAAALRVAARSAPAASLPAAPEPVAATIEAPSPLVRPAAAHALPAAPAALEMPALPQPPATPARPDPLAAVSWGEPVDGLQPGLWRTASDPIRYRTLLRNVSEKPLAFLVRMLPYDGFEVSYLIGAGGSPKIEFPVDRPDTPAPAYLLRLAPGESVLVPGAGGATDRECHPIGAPNGNYDLVQPIALYPMPPADQTQFTRLLGEFRLTRIGRDGTQRTESAVRVAAPTEGGRTLLARGSVQIGAVEPPFPLDRVVWSEAVDGLQPGLLIEKTEASGISYITLLRNRSDKPISFLTRLLPFKGLDVPTLGPPDTRPAPRRYPNYPDAAYLVRLAPGESVLVPGWRGEHRLRLPLGEGDPGENPSVTDPLPGPQLLLQPLTIYPADAGRTELMGIYWLTRVDAQGRLVKEGATRVVDPKTGGKTLQASAQIALPTSLPSDIAWGKVDRGLQCGVRLLTPRRAYRLGDTLDVEVLWRNVSKSPIDTPVPRAFDLYPIVRDRKSPKNWAEFGVRILLPAVLQTLPPGDLRSLGVVQLKLVPPGTPAPGGPTIVHLPLAPGRYRYRLSALGGVSAPGSPNPESGAIELQVVAPPGP